MPTYEYACASCGHEWEAEQSIKDAALTDCPACQAKAAKRQISRGAGFILKGGGWYSDLYSSSGNKKSEASTSTGDTEKAATTTDTPASADKKSDGGSGSTSGGSDSGGSSGGTSGGASSSGTSGTSTAASAA